MTGPNPTARLARFRTDSLDTGTTNTLLAVCPNSRDVVAAALDAARQSNAPAVFAATLNQVDSDGGYTGWTPAALASAIADEADPGLTFEPLIGLDHGGPFKKDGHNDDHLSEVDALDAAKQSIRACLDAGYEHLHIDATGSVTGEPRSTGLMADLTIDLMNVAETHRSATGARAVSYEVGVEEVATDADAALERLQTFLEVLWPRLASEGLPAPVFVVGSIGTKLDSTDFDMEQAGRVVDLATGVGALVKAHYTDDVARPELYPILGIGGANVGPGLAAVEFAALRTLCDLEAKSGGRSGFFETLKHALVSSDRWRKWTDGYTGPFEGLSGERREWLIATGSRYVWEQPAVREARMRLYDNVAGHVNGQSLVRGNLKRAILRYHEAFGLVGLLNSRAI